MNIKLTMFAVVALSSQLAFAETPIESVAGTSSALESAASGEVASQAKVSPAERAASASQIKALEHDVSPGLQSKLDQMMSFGAVPMTPSRQEVASVN